jgi:Peptidase family M28
VSAATMSKVLAMICCLGISTASIFGADNPEDKAVRTIRPEAIGAHVKFLADDLLEGRGPGTRGHDLAAKYVTAQFEAMGLEPAGMNGTFFQPIRFRSAAIVPEETSLKLVSNGNAEAFVWGQDYYATGDPREVSSSLIGQVVYVGYGVIAPDYGIDDYKSIDVRGKIVAYLYGAPARLPSAERAHYGNARTKQDTAAAHGAIGAIRLWDAEAEKLIPFARGLLQSGLPAMAWLDQNGFPNGRSNAIRTVAVLSEAGTRKLFGGSMPLGDSAALSSSISIRIVAKHSEVTSPNVVAVLLGSDPRLRDEYVIYTAHVDHLGIGAPVNGDSIYNGATDNAGGVAALIEIARAFTRLEQRQRRSVLFLAVTGEERGLLGSDYFVEYPTVPRSQIVANINMDGVNLLFDFRNIVDIGGEHSSLGTVFRRGAAKLDVEVLPDPTPEQQFFVRSDQYSFVRRGIPALFPRTGTKAVNPQVDGAKMEADRLRFRYHRPNDDLNQPLDFVAGAKTAKVDFLLGYITAQDEARPRWNEGDFFGKTFGTNLGNQPR